MPFGDGTGPNGMGPMTGRGLGYCAGYDAPGVTTGAGVGVRWGRGFGGGGRGYRHTYYATGLTGWQRASGWGAGYAPLYGPAYGAVPTREQEIAALRAQADAAERAAQNLRDRLASLEKEDKAD